MWIESCCAGSIQWPDKTSSTFSSFNGHLDKRVELYKNIQPGDIKYYAALSMMSAKISYENKAFIETTVEEQWEVYIVLAGRFPRFFAQLKLFLSGT